MTTSFTKYFLILLTALLMMKCAQMGSSLTGGVKDIYAPKIDSAGTYPLSGQTNFSANQITIKFQEYIKLNKPNDNIIITPQLKQKPLIKAKNKKLTIQFLEQLEPNTTYTINFNNAIVDITERNDSIFQHVFSTGNYIDSLTLTGTVKNAFTNRAEQDIVVALYSKDTDQKYDSIPFNNSPVYITQTAKNGAFKFSYLKAADYYLFAFEDSNKNLKLDPLEKRAFPIEKLISITEISQSINLVSFVPATDQVKLKSTSFTYPGKLQLIFTNPPKKINITANTNLLEEDTQRNDSLLFWLQEPPTTKTTFQIDIAGQKDTLKPLYKGVPEKNETIFLAAANNLLQGKLLPNTNLKLTFSEPIEKIDYTKIHFTTKDSTTIEIKNGQIENLRSIVFPTKNTKAYTLLIDSAAVQSYYGTVNRRISITNFENRTPDYYGSLIINTDSVFTTPVIMQLLNNEQKIVQEKPLQQQVIFNELLPDKYQIRLIFDTNNDGKWTTGSLIEKQQPEKVLYNNELIDVKSKWEKEIDWVLTK